MVIVLLMAGALASQGWTEAARTDIPDRISVELELGELGIAPESASYLGGESRWQSNPGGETHQQHTLRWLRLSAPPILEATAPAGTTRSPAAGSCTSTAAAPRPETSRRRSR
jgi:hypothetical protein